MIEQEYIAELHRKFIVDVEAGTLTRRFKTQGGGKDGTLAGTLNNYGYYQTFVFSKLELNHRLIWLLVHGSWPTGQIDHINRNKKDNRICNLREVSHSQNQQNQSKYCNNTSGHLGVHRYKTTPKWQAYITVNRKRIHLGYFDKLENAIAARKSGENTYFTHHKETKHD